MAINAVTGWTAVYGSSSVSWDVGTGGMLVGVASRPREATGATGDVTANSANSDPIGGFLFAVTLDVGGGTDALTAASIVSTSSVGTPTLGQVHALVASSIVSSSTVGTPALGQVHALVASSIVSSSTRGAPTVDPPAATVRVLVVPAEDRTLVVPAEDRTLTIPP